MMIRLIYDWTSYTEYVIDFSLINQHINLKQNDLPIKFIKQFFHWCSPLEKAMYIHYLFMIK